MAFIKWLCDRYQSNTIKTLVRKKKIPKKNFFHTQRPVLLVAHVVTLFLINKTNTFYIPPDLNNIILFFSLF